MYPLLRTKKCNIFCRIACLIACMVFLSTTCDDVEYEVVRIENRTEFPIVAVLTRDNPCTYWENLNDAINEGYPIKPGETCQGMSLSTRKQFYARVSVVQILIYDASTVEDDDETWRDDVCQLYKYARENRCEMARYRFTPDELAARGWKIVVTPDDIEDYRSSLGTDVDSGKTE